MNLYQVYEKNADYCTFVFAETRNRAKTIMVGYYWEEEYIDLRAITLAKDVGGKEEIIDNDFDGNYKRVTDLGFSYMSEFERNYGI